MVLARSHGAERKTWRWWTTPEAMSMRSVLKHENLGNVNI